MKIDACIFTFEQGDGELIRVQDADIFPQVCV